jgi:pSer/pThr/pTyr-binding forkhead associated (FHA) protein
MSDPNNPAPGDAYFGTRMESFEEIREATGQLRQPTVREQVQPDAMVFRPVRRPPMAVLCVLDDGREDGEWFRLRGDKFTIGRTEGDLKIPHDEMISSRHAELQRVVDRDRFRWQLVDLKSTNGTYLRVAAAVLRHAKEFMVGTHRFRFSAGMQAALKGLDEAAEKSKGTLGFQAVSPVDLVPSLLELTPQGEGRRIFLDKADHWLGRDRAQCDVLLADDPMVSPRHARLFKDDKGSWHLENARSRNGIWLRVDGKMHIDGTAQFQLGEQRFLLRVL